MASTGPDYEFPAKSRRSTWVLVALPFAAAFSILVVALARGRPPSPLQQMRDALTNVRTAKVVLFGVRFTHRNKLETDYFAPGCSRVERASGEIRIVTPTINADYRPDSKTVLLSHRTNFAQRPPEAIMENAPGPETGDSRVSVSAPFNSGGQEVYMVSDQVTPDLLVVYAIDAKTHLPLSVQKMLRSGPRPGSSWLVFQEAAISYPSSLPGALFDWTLLKGKRLIAEHRSGPNPRLAYGLGGLRG